MNVYLPAVDDEGIFDFTHTAGAAELSASILSDYCTLTARNGGSFQEEAPRHLETAFERPDVLRVNLRDLVDNLRRDAQDLPGYDDELMVSVLERLREQAVNRALDLLARAFVFEVATGTMVHIASGERIGVAAFDLMFGSLADDALSSVARDLCRRNQVIKVHRVVQHRGGAAYLYYDRGLLYLALPGCACLEDPQPSLSPFELGCHGIAA